MPSFYSENPEDALLLGDIVTGFRAVVPHVHDFGADAELNIVVSQTEYFAVTTPCCSITGQKISLAPLVQIDPQWMINPYLADDLTRINKKAFGENFWSPKKRERATPEEIQAMAEDGPVYGFGDRFVYAPDDRLPAYKLTKLPQPTGHWIIEFGSAFRVNCKKIERNIAPSGIKLLELSVVARHDLRQKMEHYYGRVPEEDREALGDLV